MKKRILIFATAVAFLSFGSFTALAQVPNVQIFFDDAMHKTEANCPAAPVGTVVDTFHVVALNFGTWLSGVEFMIDYPGGFILHLGDIFVPGGLSIGNSATGITLVYPIPVNGDGMLMSASFLWMCDDCSTTNVPVDVLPHPFSGFVRATSWPDVETIIPAVGMRALICSTVPVQETSWGQLKALYQESK